MELFQLTYVHEYKHNMFNTSNKLSILYLLFLYSISLILARYIFLYTIDILMRAGHKRENSLGVHIPTSVGLGFIFFLIIVIFINTVVYYTSLNAVNKSILFLLLVLVFGILGFLDDIVIEREKGGFKGHIRTFLKTGKPSTALFKALYGIIISALVSFLSYRLAVNYSSASTSSAINPTSIVLSVWLMQTMIIALFANAINLLDVKQGRALKGFWAAFLLLLLCLGITRGIENLVMSNLIKFLLFPLLLATIIYSPIDFKRLGMLGDAGANVLGCSLGFLVIVEFSTTGQFIAFCLLILFHIVTEIWSLSSIIEKTEMRWRRLRK